MLSVHQGDTHCSIVETICEIHRSHRTSACAADRNTTPPVIHMFNCTHINKIGGIDLTCLSASSKLNAMSTFTLKKIADLTMQQYSKSLFGTLFSVKVTLIAYFSIVCCNLHISFLIFWSVVSGRH